MPSQNQRGNDSDDYPSHEARMVDNNSTDMLTKIKVDRLETAKSWLGAANEYGDTETQEHFYAEIQRLKE